MLLAVGLLVGCGRSGDGMVGSASGSRAAAAEETDSTEVLMDLVDHYYKNVEHDSLGALAPQAMSYFSRHGRWQQYYTTWCLLVNDLVWNGQMERGFDEAQQMHDDAMRRNNAFGLSESYTAMGIAYHFQKHNTESARCYQQALQHYPKDADQSVKLNIYSYYCQVLVDAGDFETMGNVLAEWKAFLDHLTDGKVDDEETAHRYFRFHRENYKYHYGLGRYRLAKGELDQMQHYLDMENDREVYEAQVAGFRTQLAMSQRNYNDAMAWSDVEIELCRKQDFNTFLNALKHRTEVLQTLGRYEEALHAYRSYDHQKDSIIRADSRQQLNELNKRFEIDELKAHHEREALEHERTLLQIYLWVALAALSILVLFIYVRQRAAHRLKKAHALLEESNEQLQQSYEQLKVANARAEESSKMKTAFIQQISHEIRTPLNILSGFTQIVTTPGLDLDEETKRDASRQITENTDRITGLVNKMIELSEANSSTVIDRRDDVLAVQIAAQATDNSGVASAPHVIFDMQMDAQSESLMLHTNLASATRALTLLLDNARKFTRPAEARGPVAVVKQEHVTLRLEAQATQLLFIVEDTGIGVPPEEAEHVFDEFVQLDEYYDGTGIGLTVARSLARRLGGDVRLDTTYTSGARFVMTLPR